MQNADEFQFYYMKNTLFNSVYICTYMKTVRSSNLRDLKWTGK